jgi:hypothetical protein
MSDNKAKSSHAWESQTKTLDRAKDVESFIMQSSDKRKKQIDQQTK